MSSAEDIYEVMRLLRDIDADHLHAYHDPLHPRHREAVKCYTELAEWCSVELSKRGARDYQVGRGAPEPPRLRESRPGFKPS